MVNELHLYSTFIQSAVQFMPLIHTFTHQRRLAAMQGTNQLVRSNWGLGVSLKDTSTRPGWDRTSNPPTARQVLLPPEPYRPHLLKNERNSATVEKECLAIKWAIGKLRYSLLGREFTLVTDHAPLKWMCLNTRPHSIYYLFFTYWSSVAVAYPL